MASKTTSVPASTQVLFSSPYFQKKLNIPHLVIGSENIVPVPDAKNIGFIFDTVLDGKKHINSICKAGWFHLRNIGNVRPYLDKAATERLVHAFITSKLDINNALLYGLPDYLLKKLQLLQNAAARMIIKAPKNCHITPVLRDLHWLPVHMRIQYKILLTVFKALNGLAPVYLEQLLVKRSNSSRSTRLNNNNVLVVRSHKDMTATWGERNFRYCAPFLWNKLPANLRTCDSLNVFKVNLKTLLFRQT